MFKQILMPQFLNQLNQHLLLKYPLVWSSRIHFVAWYTLLAWALLIGFAFVFPDETMSSGFLGFYWLLIVLCALSGLVIWLIFLFRHNSTKQFGLRVPGREWINMSLHFICLTLISSVLFVMPAVKILQAHAAIQQKGLVEKVNVLNVNAALFPKNEYDVIPIYTPQDSNQIFIKSYNLNGSYGYYGSSDYRALDTNLMVRDRAQSEYYKIKGKVKIAKAVHDFLLVAKYYGIQHPYAEEKIVNLYDDTLSYNRDLTFEAINTSMHNSLDNLVGKDFGPIDRFDFLLDVWFYFAWLLVVIPVMLVFLTIFRNTDVKFFFISIGVTILLVAVNAILVGLALFSGSDNQGSAMMTLIVFFSFWGVALAALSFVVFGQRHYKVINAYAVFLFNLLLPVLPFIIVQLLISYDEYYYVFVDENNQKNWTILTKYSNEFRLYSYLLGLILLFISQQLYFKKLYERLWALPK